MQGGYFHPREVSDLKEDSVVAKTFSVFQALEGCRVTCRRVWSDYEAHGGQNKNLTVQQQGALGGSEAVAGQSGFTLERFG